MKVELLVRPAWRKPEGIARIQEIASRLGLSPTGAGRATVSCRADLAAFARLFHVSPVEQPPRPPAGSDQGSPGGYSWDQPLAIPEELREYVETISVVPPHTRFNR